MFTDIKSKVAVLFANMNHAELLQVGLERNELFDAYLTAFPEAERQSHRCNCCRYFLRNFGNIVTIKNGEIQTLWDFELEGEYSKVPGILREVVLNAAITQPFLSETRSLGTDFNFDLVEGRSHRWDHFYMMADYNLTTTARSEIPTVRGQMISTKDVFARGLETITLQSCETVLDLINNNALYRGAQFKSQIETFVKMKREYDALATAKAKDLFVWANFKEGGKIRNSVIGTLLVDLSEGRDLDSAIAAYGQKVDPANYQRNTATVQSASQVLQAKKFLESHNLMSALERRHATKDDVALDKMLFVNRNKQAVDPFSEIQREVSVNPKSFIKAPEVKLTDFIADVLPKAEQVELYIDNAQNVVSLLAPVHKDVEPLFSWDNNLSWTYKNNMTDCIAEKVKAKGGNVENAEARFSLEWFNFDDLDMYMNEPDGNRIYFGNKRGEHSEFFLDVDENAGGGRTRTPVENIALHVGGRKADGKYEVGVHQFRKRETEDVGFRMQIANKTDVQTYAHTKALRQDERIIVATFEVVKGQITNLVCNLDKSSESAGKVGTFQKVNMAMFSPNYWNNEVGNKHLFFILDNAKVETELRPFFNEFLRNDLKEHRKFMEQLAGKMMVPPSDDQLTGVGYSLTQQHNFVAKVDNKVIRVIA